MESQLAVVSWSHCTTCYHCGWIRLAAPLTVEVGLPLRLLPWLSLICSWGELHAGGEIVIRFFYQLVIIENDLFFWCLPLYKVFNTEASNFCDLLLAVIRIQLFHLLDVFDEFFVLVDRDLHCHVVAIHLDRVHKLGNECKQVGEGVVCIYSHTECVCLKNHAVFLNHDRLFTDAKVKHPCMRVFHTCLTCK